MFDWYHKNRRFDVSLVSSINLNILEAIPFLISYGTFSYKADTRKIHVGYMWDTYGIHSASGYCILMYPKRVKIGFVS